MDKNIKNLLHTIHQDSNNLEAQRNLGFELIKQLDYGYNTMRISSWADEYIMNNDLSDELSELVDLVRLIDSGEEFRYDQGELHQIAKSLLFGTE